ncbi:MAG: RNA polymerase sigma factor [candidate division KSB1 bacterium]|nr:RNA polymerase sigma factor [candidate division KSB1 bacterium]MDQ7063833.1 RNA polymerase sigma factor [candidate division KSB1 bacterium]
MTDDQLIEQFLSGNLHAFNTLVWRWQRPIYNFALRFLGNAEDARDVTQKTFIKAYKKLGSLKDPQKFSTWLHQIALNLCRDENKRRRKHVNISLDIDQSNHKDRLEASLMDDFTDPSAEKALQQTELQQILQKALERIPEEQRTVVILKELQGMKFTEIAELLGISVNTAKSRMYYGLNALRKILNQWNIDREAIHDDL